MPLRGHRKTLKTLTMVDSHHDTLSLLRHSVETVVPEFTRLLEASASIGAM